MCPDISIIPRESFLEFQVVGNYDYQNLIELPKTILENCRAKNLYKVLVDGSGVEKRELEIIDRFFMGEEAADILGSEVKLAIVWHPELVTGFMEAVAVNRGGQMRIFGIRKEAEKWLLTEDSETP